MIDLSAFDALADNAAVRVVPIAEKLPEDQADALLAVLNELVGQWRERGVVTDGAAAFVAESRFLLIAWNLAGADLSGCTKDQLTHTLMDFEKRLGVPMLSAPRFAVRMATGVEFMRMPDFKALRADGRVSGETTVYDHLVTTLGDVRAGRFETTVADSWYAPVGA